MSTDLSDKTNRFVSDSNIIKNSGDLSTNQFQKSSHSLVPQFMPYLHLDTKPLCVYKDPIIT